MKVKSTLDNGSTISDTVLERKSGLMALDTKANGKMTNVMGEVSIKVLMGASTVETGSTIRLKVMAYLSMLVVQDMREAGKKISNKVKVLKLILMVNHTKEVTRME